MSPSPSLRSRALAWLLWRLPFKAKWQETGSLRDNVLASREQKARPPRSLRRHYVSRETTLEGGPVFHLRSGTRPAAVHVIYLHGGAYLYDIARVQWKLLDRLMRLADIEVTVPLYPLAPETTCEDTLRWTHAVYREVRGHAGTQPIALLGDSAGGGLALALTQRLRDAGDSLPAAQILVSPWLDVTCPDPRQEQLESVDPLLALPGLRLAGSWYAGALDPADPRVSPLYGDLDGLPPTLALAGTHDLLYPDTLRLQARMQETNSQLTVIAAPDMLHVWPALPIPEAKLAQRQIADFLQGLTR